MKKQNTQFPEDLLGLFAELPQVDEVVRKLDAEKTDLELNPVFVADYLKAQFVNDIYAVMTECAISQSALAERLGESRQYVSRVLNEQANFTIETMAKFACALELRLGICLHRPEERIAVLPIVARCLQLLTFPSQEQTTKQSVSLLDNAIPSSAVFNLQRGKYDENTAA